MMMIAREMTRRSALGLAAGLALVLGAGAAWADWPERPITFVVGFGPGGSADRTARLLAQYLGPELGQPITVVNREGAGGQLAASYVLAQPPDGYTLLATAISPYLANSIIHTEAPYEMSDFAFINGQWSDYDLIAARPDLELSDLSSLLTSIKENPGQHSVSVVPSSAGHLTAYLLLDAADIPFENLRIVTYESGGAARTAVAGGQVDFTILGAEGSEGVRDLIKPLAVVREEPVDAWDAPPVNEALEPLGIEIPVLSGSIRGLAAPAAFKEAHPEAFERLVTAYQAVLEDPDFQEELEANAIGGDWLGPERTTEVVMRNYEVIERYAHLLD